MKIFYPKQLLVKLSLLIVTVITFYACQKEINGDTGTGPVDPPAGNTNIDLTTKVTAASISGFVTDETNTAILGASVAIGISTVTTDKYGYFEVKNPSVVKNAAVITVSKSGYFKGIKTYMAETDKSAFFRIKLIPKTTAGTFTGATGGTITITGGSKIVFPANAIVTAASGAAYTGVVSVAAYWINPAATDLNATMPGDLRGIDKDNFVKQLTTYGMIAAELTGATGELLQIATGKKASISVTIPSSLVASAPAAIPLWHFDESAGLWREEGVATKTGNEYIGDVSHFSFWNYDVPANYVQVSLTLKTSTGQPIAFTPVKISVVSNPANATWGYTDSSGYVIGAVPNSSQLKLEVFANTICAGVAHSQTFTTTTTNVALGTISINMPTLIATLQGTVTNCADAPVTNGYVIIKIGTGVYQRLSINNNGNFQANLLLCDAGNTYTAEVIAEDLTALQQSNTTTYTIHSGTNMLGNIKACGVTIESFFRMTINATDYNFSLPVDSLTYFEDPSTSSIAISVNNGSANILFSKTNITVGSSQPLYNFRTNYINDSTTIVTPIGVTITEAGASGQFLSGNFTGAFKGGLPANTIYNVIVSFRIRRD